MPMRANVLGTKTSDPCVFHRASRRIFTLTSTGAGSCLSNSVLSGRYAAGFQIRLCLCQDILQPLDSNPR